MKRGLGKGLADLLNQPEGELVYLDVSLIKPNPFQPRREFKNLEPLAQSIKENGMLQPVIVRRKDGEYFLVAGERRWRAAVKAGLKRIPAIVKEVSDREAAALALVENTLREDLSPLEIAEDLEKLRQGFHLSHEELARITGMDRSSVTNLLRLLKLPGKIKEALHRGEISMGQARALLSVQDPGKQMELFERIRKRNMTVRDVEEMVRREKARGERKLSHIEEEISRALGTRVIIGRKVLKIYFRDKEELERILLTLRGGKNG